MQSSVFPQFSFRQPGYKQMKVLRQDRNTVCFIEFEVISYTTTTMFFISKQVGVGYK
jgi:hypothetical protein